MRPIRSGAARWTGRASCALALVVLAGMFLPLRGDSAANLLLRVELKEWLVLDVASAVDRGTTLGSSGGAAILSRVPVDGQPVEVKVLLSVRRGQAVRLRVRTLGAGAEDTAGISWRASGPGFSSEGRLDAGAGTIAGWTGPGAYVGTVVFSKGVERPPDVGEDDARTVLLYRLEIS